MGGTWGVLVSWHGGVIQIKKVGGTKTNEKQICVIPLL